jgi:hypothetical protein
VPPLNTGEKFAYRITSIVGPTKLFTLGVYAAYDQATNTPGEWERGASGYGKRYANQIGGTVARQTMAFAGETLLHEDPRYFPSGEKGFMKRTKNALKQAFITRKDDGSNRFAYSRVGSAFGAAWVQYSWQPRSTQTTSDAMTTFAVTLAGDAAYNFLQEFIPRLRPKELRDK